ncbi:MAG: conjugal transfer protein TraB [Deltaproteobacteria bacterium RBG_13_49_15]|nr:MAG: conjugal transfer protein TraB [Deltaproteobacteria bacterium RBG_13_49_15]
MEIKENGLTHRILSDGKEILLLGTAHVSKESAHLVQSVIETEKPDTVAVELCESRYQAITQRKKWEETDIFKVIREKKTGLLMLNLLLASFQKRVANKLGVRPGEEMLSAIKTAESVGARIHLADRNIRTTLMRVWHAMGTWDKIKLLIQLILSISEAETITEKDIEQMKQEDMIQSFLLDVGKKLPALRQILIDERDRYLAYSIRNAPGKKIVAVIGAGHLPGIRSCWNEEIDVAALESIPQKRMSHGLWKWILPVLVLTLFIAGFFYGGAATGKEMITKWVLVTGFLAGLGAAAALAHPYSILSSILAAPLTSIHPMIAAGWISGMVEAFLRRPKVKDFQNIPDDILSVRGFWQNRVTHILLVIIFTNLGSALGTLVALPMMIRVL